MFWVQTLLVVVVAIGVPLALFIFIRRKQLSTNPTYQWAVRVEELEKQLKRGLATAEGQVKAASAEHTKKITRDRAEALRRQLATLDVGLLVEAQGIGPSVIEGLRNSGYQDVGAVANAFSLQGVPGVGPEREKTLRALARKIADAAERDFHKGKGPEAAAEREREAKATRDLEVALREPRRTIAAFRVALENLSPRLALAHQNGSGLFFSWRSPALLSPETLNAPLPTIDEFLGMPVEPVPMPPSQAPRPLPEAPREKVEVDQRTNGEVSKPRTSPAPRPIPVPSVPRKTSPGDDGDLFDPGSVELDLPAKSPVGTGSGQKNQTSSVTPTQSPGEQLLSWFETMVDLGLSAAKCDGRVVEFERKNLLNALRERFAGEKAITTHVEIDACLAGREALDLDSLRERLLVLRVDQRRWAYRLCCKVMGPAADRNTKEVEYLALLRRMLNLKAPNGESVDLADPESVLEFDLEREVTADGVRRQKNLLWDKYDPEKAASPQEAERFKARREQIAQATTEILERLGVPAEAPAPAEDPFAVPGSRHNPDLDDILG